jgi:hypothetical protein
MTHMESCLLHRLIPRALYHGLGTAGPARGHQYERLPPPDLLRFDLSPARDQGIGEMSVRAFRSSPAFMEDPPMVQKLTAPLRKALRQLEAEKQRIDRQITAVRAALKALGDTGRGTPASSTRAKARRRGMSAAARRAVSQRMKAYWAKRKAASAKGKAKGTQKGD